MSISARDELLQHLLNTLSADNGLRTTSEQYLNSLIDQQPESLATLLDLTTDTAIPFQIRLVAATFVKNKVKGSWFIHAATNRYLKAQEIPAAVKEQLKQKLVGTLLRLSPFEHQALFRQILNCIHVILRIDHTWDEPLYQAAEDLLQTSQGDASKMYVGLSLVYQIAKKHCFDMGDRRFTETIASKQFPMYEQMFGSVSQIKDAATGSVFYLILKIYKFCTFSQLPPYLTSDMSRLDKWVDFHLAVCKVEPTFETEEEDGDEDEMVKKCQKWAFANLYRLKKRHAKKGNKLLDPQVVEALLSQTVPRILTEYFTSFTGRRFTDICYYYLIAFLTDCISADTIYTQFLKDNVKPVLSSVIVPRLACTASKIETFEDDPVEYLRRYIDSSSVTGEFKGAENAASEFVFMLCRIRFNDVAQDLFGVLQQIFQDKGSHLYAVEAGLKVLKNCWAQMAASDSAQMDQAVQYFIVPQLTDSANPWLQTVACDTVASIEHKFGSVEILKQASGAVMQLIETSSEHMALQLEAISALDGLCVNEAVRDQAADSVTGVVELLLRLNSRYELEMASGLMDDFVLKFSKELEPFAVQLCKGLNDQFLQGAQELLPSLTSANHTDDEEREAQLLQFLRTMSTMVLSMTSQRETTAAMERTFEPSVSFILDNAMLEFVPDAMDLLETTNFVLKTQTEESWKIYDTVLESFENYGYEYFDNYTAYFQTVVNYGFENASVETDPHLQKLLEVLLDFYKNANDDEEMLDFVFNLLALVVLNCNNVEALLDPFLRPVFQSVQTLSIDVLRMYLRLFIALLLKRPDLAGSLSSGDPAQLVQFMEIWFSNSEELLTTVFDLKLEILCLIRLLGANLAELDSFKESMLKKLVELVDQLPQAIDKRVKLMRMEDEGKLDPVEFGGPVDEAEGEIDVDDDEYAELNVDTPLDHVNVMDEFQGFVRTQTVH